MSYLRTEHFYTDTELSMMHYLNICDDIRIHIPFSDRYIYQHYFDTFHKYHAEYRLFLQRPKWQQYLIRVYHKLKGYL
jgi:hypothetical protein